MRKKMMIFILAGSIASSSIAMETNIIGSYYGVKAAKSLVESGLQAFQAGANLIFTRVHSIIKFMKNPQRFLAKRYFKLKKLKTRLNQNMLHQQIGASEKQLRRLQRRAANLNFNINFIEKIFPKKSFTTIEQAMKGRLSFDQINLKKKLNRLKTLKKIGRWTNTKDIMKQMRKLRKNLKEIESITGKMAQ